MRKRVVLVIDEEYIELSTAASRLWAKSDDGLNEEWLPLFLHMIDAAHVAGMLWDCWVPVSYTHLWQIYIKHVCPSPG